MKFKSLSNYIVAFFLIGGFALIAYAENELTALDSSEQVSIIKKNTDCTQK